MIIDFDYCNKIINALICIRNSATAEKSIEISAGTYTLALGSDPDTNWIDFSLKYKDISDCIGIDIHNSLQHQAVDGNIKMYKRIIGDEDSVRFKTFLNVQHSDAMQFSFFGFDTKVDTTKFLSVNFDDEEYFQYSTLYNIPSKEELLNYRELYYKVLEEVSPNTNLRLSYVCAEINEDDLEEIIRSLYSVVPIFKK